MTSPRRTFPEDFLWGSATASYQIEGGYDEDGRTFVHLGHVLPHARQGAERRHRRRRRRSLPPVGRGRRADQGTRPAGVPVLDRVAADPAGRIRARSTRQGIAFYDRLVDALLDAGVQPVATLYHWDLPQELEDAGGWVNRETALRFADYAEHVAGALGDRISVWTTLNEPWCSAFLGYAAGVHAPGRTERRAALAAAHHLNLGARARPAARSGRCSARTRSCRSPSTCTSPGRSTRTSAADRDAVRQLDAVGNRVFLGPMLDGAYPEDLLADTAHVTDWSFVQDGDEATARCRCACWASTTTRPPGRGTVHRRGTASCRPTATATRRQPVGRRRRRRVRAAAGPVHRDGLEHRPVRDDRAAHRHRRPLPRTAADGHRERCRLLRRRLDGRPGARRRPGRRTCTATSTRSVRPARPASTCAATSCGRCWTTSSGPGGTTGGSASSGSTTTPRAHGQGLGPLVRRTDPRPGSCRRWTPPTGASGLRSG